MKTKRHAMKALTSACSTLVLAGALLTVNGWAQTAGTDGSTEADVTAQQGAPDVNAQQEVPDASAQQEAPDVSPMEEAPDVSATGSQERVRQARRSAFKGFLEQTRLAKENAARNGTIPAAVSRPAPSIGMTSVGGKQEGSVSTPSPAVVSRPAALAGINVSFKLDPQLTKSLHMYTGESWISPPISLYAGAQDGATPTVEAKADVLDAKGQSVDISPEWIPADPEMVTVSPEQGNAVQITVRHAGQSNLRVASQKLYTQLSIMAWYRDNALQVEISQKP